MRFQEQISDISERLSSGSTLLPNQHRRNQFFGAALFLPALLFLCIFIILPLLYVFNVSLHEMSILADQGTFVGLENYRTLLTMPEMRSAFWIGTVYAAGTVAFQLVIGLFIALTLNRNFFGSSLVRTLAILPYLVPVIAVVLMWRWIADPNFGLVNHFLVSWGIVSDAIAFFGTPQWAMPSLIVASSWKFIPFCVLIFLARLQSIDDVYYEQAKISGANIYQMFTTITLPNLRSAILLVVLLRLVWMFNKFGIIYLFTGGGPLGSTTNVPVFIYETTFNNFQLGLGSAAAILLFVILAVAAVIYFWYFKPSKEIATDR